MFPKLFPPNSQFLLGWVAQSCPKLSIEGSRLGWIWDFLGHEGTSIEEVHPVVLNLFPPYPNFRLGRVVQPFPKLSI